MSMFSGDASVRPRLSAKNTIVEIDGDEMTRVIWAMVKAQLIEPFVELKLERYDLHVQERDRTDDQVTVYAPAGGGVPQSLVVHEFKAPGIVRGVHNVDSSIRSFARACINYALIERMDLWFSAKDTIAKIYHGAFREIFRQETDARRADFQKAGIQYVYMLIDDAVAKVVRSPGGFLWAGMNYDGDVMSDMVASGFGSLGLMTSVLVTPDGLFEFEAAHGTVTRHFRKHERGEPTSTNSTATIFAWTGAIAKRGELDGTPELVEFA